MSDTQPHQEKDGKICDEPECVDKRAKLSAERKAMLEAAAIVIAARTAHEVNRVYCQSLGDDSQLPWDEASEEQRNSCVAGVTLIVRHPTTTAAQSHSCWMAHKLSQGWVLGPKNEAAMTHPCLLPYAELSDAQKLKDKFFGAAVRAVLGIPSPE